MTRLLARIGRISSCNMPASPVAMSPPASGRRMRSANSEEKRACPAQRRAQDDETGNAEQRRLLAEGQHGEQRRIERHEHAAQIDQAHQDRQESRQERRQGACHHAAPRSSDRDGRTGRGGRPAGLRRTA